MNKTPGKFKPFIGRCFELKSFLNLKKFPPVVMIMDENNRNVMFLDQDGNATWISKYYIRDKPIESRVFSSADTLTEVMGFMETMRTELETFYKDQEGSDKKKLTNLNKSCSRLLQELRDLGTRTRGVEYAPPLSDDPVED